MTDEINKYLYKLSLYYLSRRQRSEKEIRDYLKKKFNDLDQIDKVVTKLKEQRFLDDYEFAKTWIENRIRLKPKGWSALAFELKLKGISKEIIEELRIKNYESKTISEKDIIKELIKKRIDKYVNLPKQKIYQKLGGFLLRRGFGIQDVKACIDEFLVK